MGNFFKFVAMILLATWLPATQHDALELMGILPDHSEGVPHHHDHGQEETPHEHSAHDAIHDWHFVEKTITKPSIESLKGPVFVALFTITLLAGLFVTVPKLREAVFRKINRHIFQRPLSWVPDWHFERRAVASPRAPAFIA